jgi:hypothetical protein
MDMIGMSTKEYLKIIYLGSYDFIIVMDWLKMHHVILDFYNKDLTCLDEIWNLRIIEGIPRVVSIRDISSLWLKLKEASRKDVKYLYRKWKWNSMIKCELLNIMLS